jgi:hypothetical protein
LQDDDCWRRTIAEIENIPDLKEAWDCLRQALIAAFAEKRVWKEWRGKIKRVCEILGGVNLGK